MTTKKRTRRFNRNPVAKYAHKFNKSSRMTTEKLKAKQGYCKHKGDLLND